MRNRKGKGHSLTKIGSRVHKGHEVRETNERKEHRWMKDEKKQHWRE